MSAEDSEGRAAGTSRLPGSGTAPSERGTQAGPALDEPVLSPGTLIGRYVVLNVLGAGGVGVVYAAYDAQLDRMVAVKLLRRTIRSRESAEAQGRFLREAKALAKLSHPNVVSVYDAGSCDGRLFLTMELVKGQTLAEWASKGASPRAVLSSLLAAGEGLAAAHAAGVVHRDFKPANVMVSEDGRVQVLDFGLAQVGPEEADEPEALRSGVCDEPTLGVAARPSQAYVAPEQRDHGVSGPLADQYAFCVTAWELLFGERPFELSAHGPDRWRVRSLARSRVPLGVQVALQRGLAAAPEQRWPDMAALLEALSTDRAQRRRWALGLLASAGLLAAGVGVPIIHARWTCRQAAGALDAVFDEAGARAVGEAFARSPLAYATETWRRARPVVTAYASAWRVARERVCLGDVLEGPDDAELRSISVACLDEAKAALSRLATEWEAPQEANVRAAGVAARTLPPVETCLDRRELQRRTQSAATADGEEVRRIRSQLSEVDGLSLAASLGKAEALAEDLAERTRALGDPGLEAAAQLRLGTARAKLGKFSPAREALVLAYSRADVAGDDLVALRSANGIIRLNEELADFEGARTWAWLSQMKATRLNLGEQHPLVAVTLNNLGRIDAATGRLKEAAEAHVRAWSIFSQAMGPDHPDVGDVLNGLGSVHYRLGQRDDALDRFRQALALHEASLGAEHPAVGYNLHNIGLVLLDRGDFEAARETYERVLRIWERALGPEHSDVAHALDRLAVSLQRLGRYDEARGRYLRALASLRRALGDENPAVASVYIGLGGVAEDLGEYEEGQRHYEEAARIWEKSFGPESFEVSMVHSNIGQTLLARGQPAAAREHFERSISGAQKTVGSEHSDLAFPLFGLGQALLQQRELAAARGALGRALTLREKHLGPEHPLTAATLGALAEVDLALHRDGEAIAGLERALRIQVDLGLVLERGETERVLVEALWRRPRERPRARALAREAHARARSVPTPPGRALVEALERWMKRHDPTAAASTRAP